MSAAKKTKAQTAQRPPMRLSKLGQLGSEESQIRYRLATYDCGPTAERDFREHAHQDIEWLLEQLDGIADAMRSLLEAEWRANNKHSDLVPDQHVSIDEIEKVIREKADTLASMLVHAEKSEDTADNDAELEQAQKALADEQAEHKKTKAELVELRGRIARAVRELHNKTEEATAAE